MLQVFLAALALSAGDGLVAHWDFREGEGAALHDLAGRSHGKIHGAEWVSTGDGYALRFDGVHDYVDCGNDPSLDLRTSLTLEAWIKPLGKPSADAGVIGKFFGSYLITYYPDGNCWWYIDSGTNHQRAPVALKKWNHLVATFDGETMAVYVNGTRVAQGKSKFPQAGKGSHFLMGRSFPDMTDVDEEYAKIKGYNGLIGDVRVYDCAMDMRTAQLRYKQEAGKYGHDTDWFDRIRLVVYPYPDRYLLVAEATFKGLRFPSNRAARRRASLSCRSPAGSKYRYPWRVSLPAPTPWLRP